MELNDCQTCCSLCKSTHAKYSCQQEINVSYFQRSGIIIMPVLDVITCCYNCSPLCSKTAKAVMQRSKLQMHWPQLFTQLSHTMYNEEKTKIQQTFDSIISIKMHVMGHIRLVSRESRKCCWRRKDVDHVKHNISHHLSNITGGKSFRDTILAFIFSILYYCY